MIAVLLARPRTVPSLGAAATAFIPVTPPSPGMF